MIPLALRNLVPAIRMQRGMARQVGLRGVLRMNWQMISSLLASRGILRSHYRLLSEADVRALRTSDRAFVFGSGYSLHDLTQAEWDHISGHNTIGFNAFVFQNWVRVDFHVVRGWGEGAGPDAHWGELVKDFSGPISRSRWYKDTVFACQDDYMAQFSHELILRTGLPKGAKIFPFRTNRSESMPSLRFSDGLVHGIGTLCDAVNFAVCMGFKEIVLVGVDLYDTRYFWIDPQKTIAIDYRTGLQNVQERTDRGQRFDEPHSTVGNGIIELMSKWSVYLRKHGTELRVYNPRSLLAQVMPVYQPQEAVLKPALSAARP